MAPIIIKLLAAVVLGFVLTAALGKVVIPALRRMKAGQSIKEDGPTWHMAKQGTPTMGGVMFILAAVLVCLTVGLPGMLQGHFEHIFVLLFSLVFGAIGLLDDWKKIRREQNMGLTTRGKFVLQLIAALLYIFTMKELGFLHNALYLPISGKVIPMPAWLFDIFAVFVVVGTVNAVNISDGVDGLAAGTSGWR